MSSFRAAMMATRASFAFAGIFAVLLLTSAGAEEKPDKLPQPSLIVTPAGSIAFSGPRGGPFSPERFEFRVSSTAGIVNYSILAHGQSNLWHDRHSRCHNHSDGQRQRVTSFARRIWTWRRVHERVERPGHHDQAGKADYPSVFASSCDRTNRTQPWWKLLAGRPRRIPVGRPRWPFAGAVTGARRRVFTTDTFA